MNDGLLTQEEIDSLLKGESVKAEPAANTQGLNDIERDTLGEIGNISMGTSATTLSTLLRRKVSITTPKVALTTGQELQSSYPRPYLVVEVKYREGLQGSNILVVKKEDAAVIADLMMGGDGQANMDTLDELHISAVSEAMNQMMGSATTSLSSMFNMKIDIAPPYVNMVDLGTEDLQTRFGTDFIYIVQISFRMVIEDLVDSEIMQIIPLDAGHSMVNTLLGNMPDMMPEGPSVQEIAAVAAPAPPPRPTAVEPPTMAAAPPPVAPIPTVTYDSYLSGPSYGASNINQNPVAVKPVQFAPLSNEHILHEPKNIGLILDVPLEITVELGRTKKTIKEILEMGPGSIIQLEKLAGEPVDLLVNGKLIAKGEVVVIDETYGVRINAIISPLDRVSKLQ